MPSTPKLKQLILLTEYKRTGKVCVVGDRIDPGSVLERCRGSVCLEGTELRTTT